INEEDRAGVIDSVQYLVAETDKLITARAPWKLAKSDSPDSRKDLEEVLYVCCEAIRHITALIHPVLPYTTAKIWAQLGLGDIEVAAKNGELNNLQWGGLKPGTKLGALGPIFPRADKELIKTMNEMEQNNNASVVPAAEAPATTAPVSAEATPKAE